jgi:hypothetical protein
VAKRIIPLFLIILLLVACGREAATAVKPATVQTKNIPVVTATSSEFLADVITAAVAEVGGMEAMAAAPLVDSHVAKNNIKQISTLDLFEPAVAAAAAEAELVAVTVSEPVITIQEAGSTTVTENVGVVEETAVTNDTPISQPPPPADNGNPPASDTPSQPAPPSSVNDEGSHDDNSGPGNHHDDDDDDHDDEDDNSGPGNHHDDDDDDHDDDD